jgi:N-acetylglucosaminyl-diphospho-decaprenol L-rhamnosyltransferase
MLQSLEKHAGDANFEIILTENLPTSQSISPDEFPEFKLHPIVNAKPQGFAANHNQAAKFARGKYFCLLNPDVVFVEAIFPILITELEAGLGDIAAPLVLNSEGEIQDSFRDLPSPLDLLRRRLKTWQPPKISVEENKIYPHWIAAICLIMRLETYQYLGGLDEKFYLYFEDVDYGSRARLMGKKLFVVTQCRIIHDARRSSHRRTRHLIHHLIAATRFFTSDVYRKAKKIPPKEPTN